MKLSDRSAQERAAIGAWVRVLLFIRESACLKIQDDFKKRREESISQTSPDIAKMVSFYAAYQKLRPSASYTEYFQVANPAEYAAILAFEKEGAYTP